MDNIETMILNEGYLTEPRLHKRWIVAQMLHNMHYEQVSYTAFINQKPYRYQWTTLLQELKAISKMKKNLIHLKTTNLDVTEDLQHQIKISESFFNRELAEKMLTQYLDTDLPMYAHRYAKTKRYAKTYGDKDINLLIIDTNAYVKSILAESDDNVFLKKLEEFVNTHIFIPSTANKFADWINAFTYNGAYFTMHDLIKFHDCKFESNPNATTQETIKYLNKIPHEELFAHMTDMIVYNNISLENIA